MVHIASVWVPFTSESKEAIASYPEIKKELRLGLQAVGRKLAMYLNRRKRCSRKANAARFSCAILARWPHAVATIKDYGDRPRKDLYDRLVDVAKRKTAVADTQLDDAARSKRENAPRNLARTC